MYMYSSYTNQSRDPNFEMFTLFSKLLPILGIRAPYRVVIQVISLGFADNVISVKTPANFDDAVSVCKYMELESLLLVDVALPGSFVVQSYICRTQVRLN